MNQHEQLVDPRGEEVEKHDIMDETENGDERNNSTTTTTKTSTTSSLSSSSWPEEANLDTPWYQLVYRRWTFSYMNPILAKGSLRQKQQQQRDGATITATTASEEQHHHPSLTIEDLYPIPPSMKSNLITSQFMNYYNEQQQQATNTRGGGEGKHSQQQHRVLLYALWRLAAPTFVPAGVCQLMAVLCQVAVPYMVRELLGLFQHQKHSGQSIVQQEPGGIGLVFGIATLLALNAIFTHRHRHLATKSGIVMRAAVVNVVYQHALRLTPRGKHGLTSGEVTNLIAIDTQKLFEVTQEGHLIWSMPLSVILVTVLLLLIMGPATLVGVAALIAFVPLVERLASIMLRIRQARVKLTDQRVQIVNTMLQGIRVTKLNNWEESYQKRIEHVRNREVRYLKWELAVWGFTLVVTVITPVVAAAATFATFVLISSENRLTSAETFSVLLLFAALRFPINYAGRLIGRAAQAVGSIRRLSAFLSREARRDDNNNSNNNVLDPLKNDNNNEESSFTTSKVPQLPNGVDSSATPHALVVVENGEFRVGGTSRSNDDEATVSRFGFQLSGINLIVQRGQILAVCGPVGSGKSTLILGLIDEIQALAGTIVNMHGKAAYVSQTPFILNATLRENILFGLPMDDDRYARVVDACCLRADIEQLGQAGDLTEIGERGVTLSGGQKQRVSLARAAYAQPDVVLCDDPLSALDAGTAKKVFERLFRNPTNPTIFSKSAVILVTHASHFLNRVDQILVIVDGRSKFVGSWAELIKFKPTDATTTAAVEFIQASVQEAHTKEGDNIGEGEQAVGANSTDLKTKSTTTGKEKDGGLITKESREHGLSSLKTWLLWFTHAGGSPFLCLQLLLMTIDRLAYVGVEYWLARWTQGADTPVTFFGAHFRPQSDGIQAQYRYLKVYAIILTISIVATIARSEWVVTGGARCAKKVFSAMLASTLRAPVSYFESTPMGRILNRYTYDMEIADLSLTEAMSTFMIAMSWFVASIVILCTIIPWILLGLVPIIVLYGFLLLHYRRSGPDLQRIDAVSRSPIQAMLTEGLDGASTIRVYQQEKSFMQCFQTSVDSNSSALLNFVSAQRWLGVRIEFLGSLVVLLSCLLVIILNNSLNIPAGIVGLLIIWSVNFTVTLGFLVDNFSESESAITSIERVDAMSRLPEEQPMTTSDHIALRSTWPEAGCLEFKSVSLRYRKNLPLALNGLTFSVPAGKRCAVVGRTGAGKSSLTVALFRLVEIESGSILLDGVDLSSLGLRDVRGRGMSIIPQDPFLAGTSIRECIDPFQRSSDHEVLEALKAVRLANPNDDLGVLDQKVEEGGSNFSVGERQLLNLARALLAKPRLLVLDEATASVDGETDAFIQSMLRTRFNETTLLTVAHRLNTIMDYDLVLVMDGGQAVQFGPPGSLLAQAHGPFDELVNSTGPDSAKALKAMTCISEA